MPRRRTLSSALEAASSLRQHVRPGMQAIQRADVQLIADSQRARIGDSLDLDAASHNEHPNDHRWDYLLSVPDAGRLVGVEPHTASDHEIAVVIAKKNAALDYLTDHLRRGQRVDAWFWVTRGQVGFGKMDRARRRLDQAGIAFAGRQLRSLDD